MFFVVPTWVRLLKVNTLSLKIWSPNYATGSRYNAPISNLGKAASKFSSYNYNQSPFLNGNGYDSVQRNEQASSQLNKSGTVYSSGYTNQFGYQIGSNKISTPLSLSPASSSSNSSSISNGSYQISYNICSNNGNENDLVSSYY